MSKVKYYYDSETLSYRKIEKKKGRKLKIFALSLLGMFLSGWEASSFVTIATGHWLPWISGLTSYSMN